MSTEEQTKVKDLIDDFRFGMLTTVDHGEGRLVSRPMAVQEVDDDGALWFLTDEAAPKADQLERDPTVNIAFSSNTTWVSVAGRATIVDDQERVRELWNPAAEAWFPDGPDGGGVGLLRVDPDSAEYWESPGGRIATVISYAKSKVTGKRPDLGENETVEL